MSSPADLFLTLNAIDFTEASLRAVEHCPSIRRGPRKISAGHLNSAFAVCVSSCPLVEEKKVVRTFSECKTVLTSFASHGWFPTSPVRDS
jgi:hypothetical protein